MRIRTSRRPGLADVDVLDVELSRNRVEYRCFHDRPLRAMFRSVRCLADRSPHARPDSARTCCAPAALERRVSGVGERQFTAYVAEPSLGSRSASASMRASPSAPTSVSVFVNPSPAAVELRPHANHTTAEPDRRARIAVAIEDPRLGPVVDVPRPLLPPHRGRVEAGEQGHDTFDVRSREIVAVPDERRLVDAVHRDLDRTHPVQCRTNAPFREARPPRHVGHCGRCECGEVASEQADERISLVGRLDAFGVEPSIGRLPGPGPGHERWRRLASLGRCHPLRPGSPGPSR